jgi:NAD(P)H-hydrate epimerase
MIKVLTNDEMRELDSSSIRDFSIPGSILMENAAVGVCNSIKDKFGETENKVIFVFTGKGNNAGDGFAIARHLYNRMANVFVFCLSDPADLSGDALMNYNILSNIFNYPEPDLIIDAIFGIGVRGDIEGIAKDVIIYCNKSNTPKISVDIPSGLNGTTGEKSNVAVKADLTITMALPKIGLLINEGPRLSGDLEVVDISIPEHMLLNNRSRTYLLQEEDIGIRLPRREFDAYKYSAGKVFILAGSIGLTGAAALCSDSALHVGSGAVILGLPESLNSIMEEKVTEVMTLPLPETSDKTLSYKGLDKIIQYINWSDVTLIGPGLGQHKDTKKLILEIISKVDKPLVIDADGLNNLKDNENLIRNYKNEIIITPHYGELSRLINKPTNEIAFNRISVARSQAKELNATIILKGAPTVIADKNGNVYINSTGNPGMATAGSGDVLAGMVAGFFAQNKNAVDASILSVYLHGYAGDLAQLDFSSYSMTAINIKDSISPAIKKFIL